VKPSQQLLRPAVGEDLRELRAEVRDQADALDDHVDDAPAALAMPQPVVDRHAVDASSDDARAHGDVPARLYPLSHDLHGLLVVALQPASVGGSQVEPELRDEVLALLAGEPAPVALEHQLGRREEIEAVEGDGLDLAAALRRACALPLKGGDHLVHGLLDDRPGLRGFRGPRLSCRREQATESERQEHTSATHHRALPSSGLSSS